MVSLSEHNDDAVKYFAGSAEYRRRFDVPSERISDGVIHRLDLGDVRVLAQVTLNGRDLGTLWHAPYDVDVSDVLAAGENILEIRVTTTWANRLIGDERLTPHPAKRRGPSSRSLPFGDLLSGNLPDTRSTFTTLASLACQRCVASRRSHRSGDDSSRGSPAYRWLDTDTAEEVGVFCSPQRVSTPTPFSEARRSISQSTSDDNYLQRKLRVSRYLLVLTTIGVSLLWESPSNAGGPAHSLSVGEGFVNPLGYHDADLRFSWKLPVGVVKQTAYRVEARSDGRVVWDSGWVTSDQSVRVAYQGEPLRSRQRLSWRVDYRDETEKASGWSAPASVELGLLSKAEWQASWISAREQPDLEEERVAWLRRDFHIDDEILRARLHVTALGAFEMSINGERVGAEAFAPGWTSYADRVHSLTYDVTDHLTSGNNAIGAMLGTGWYAGRLGWKHDKARRGRIPKLLVQLEIETEDGGSTMVLSDGKWKATLDGPIRSSSIYDGETYDARREMTGWGEPGFDDSQWGTVAEQADLGRREISPKPFPPVRGDRRSRDGLNHGADTGSLRLRPRPEHGRVDRFADARRFGRDRYDSFRGDAQVGREHLHGELPIGEVDQSTHSVKNRRFPLAGRPSPSTAFDTWS